MMAIDCRSEEGITTGLIDAMISIARVLRPRLEADGDMSIAILDAWEDIGQDEDVSWIVNGGLARREND